MILGLHLADHILPLSVELSALALSCGLLVWSSRTITDDHIPRIGIICAAYFVMTQIHFRTPLGSVHLIGNGVLAYQLGISSFLPIGIGLGLQAVLLAHGGVWSFGVNYLVVVLPTLGIIAIRPCLRVHVRRYPFWTGLGIGFVASTASTVFHAFALSLWGPLTGSVTVLTVSSFQLPLIGIEALGTGWIVAWLESSAAHRQRA